MPILERDGVHIHFDDVGQGQEVVFVHGWGCNRSFFKHQIHAFSPSHRVISLDLRGHGMSEAPEQDYTMRVFADDIAWLCNRLNVRKPIIVGHSMGGNIALELAVDHPSLAKGIVLIDSLVFPSANFVEQMKPALAGLQTSDYRLVVRQVAEALFIASDDLANKQAIVAVMEATPQHVLASSFAGHTINYDAAAAAEVCVVPAAYIGSANPLGDINLFRSKCPSVLSAQTLGAGHFSPLEVPDQINAMLGRFMKLYD